MFSNIEYIFKVMKRNCANHRDRFCYICGQVTFQENRSLITTFIKRTYHNYFGMKLGDQDKSFAPHKGCKTCVEVLPFGIPMVWREGVDHTTDCYFCMTNLNGISRKKKHHLKYPLNQWLIVREFQFLYQKTIPIYHQLVVKKWMLINLQHTNFRRTEVFRNY